MSNVLTILEYLLTVFIGGLILAATWLVVEREARDTCDSINVTYRISKLLELITDLLLTCCERTDIDFHDATAISTPYATPTILKLINFIGRVVWYPEFFKMMPFSALNKKESDSLSVSLSTEKSIHPTKEAQVI